MLLILDLSTTINRQATIIIILSKQFRTINIIFIFLFFIISKPFIFIISFLFVFSISFFILVKKMLNNVLLDLHTHNRNSFDSETDPFDMCASAINKGISTLAITDHVDIDLYFSRGDNVTVRTSYDDMLQSICKYSDTIEILKGIELGQPLYNIEISESILKKYDYDIVLGSIHNLRNMKDFSRLDYKSMSTNHIISLLKEHFYEEKLLVSWGKIDVLAHITYPLRYICGECGINIDMDVFTEDIKELFDLLIEKECVLEINTSGLRQKLNSTMPGFDIIKTYYQMGGRLLSFGSDSHQPEFIGYGIPQAIEMAKNIGFNRMIKFVNRKPIEISL